MEAGASGLHGVNAVPVAVAESLFVIEPVHDQVLQLVRDTVMATLSALGDVRPAVHQTTVSTHQAAVLWRMFIARVFPLGVGVWHKNWSRPTPQIS